MYNYELHCVFWKKAKIALTIEIAIKMTKSRNPKQLEQVKCFYFFNPSEYGV